MQSLQVSLVNIEDLKAVLSSVVASTIDERLQLLTPPKQDEFITRAEIAKELGIALSTLHEYTLSGIIPAYRLGSRVRYKRSDIDAALKQIRTSKQNG